MSSFTETVVRYYATIRAVSVFLLEISVLKRKDWTQKQTGDDETGTAGDDGKADKELEMRRTDQQEKSGDVWRWSSGLADQMSEQGGGECWLLKYGVLTNDEENSKWAQVDVVWADGVRQL